VREEDWARADTLIRRKFGAVPFSDQVLYAVVRGDTAAERRLREQALEMAGKKGRRTKGWAVEAGWFLATYQEDLGRAEEFARFGAASSIPPGLQATAHELLAGLGVAGGRWSAAELEFAAAAAAHPDSALIGRALAASLPFLAVPKPALEAIRGEVDRWTPGSDVSSPLPESIRPLTGHLRLYLLGLLSVRLGAVADALRYAGEIQRLPAPPESGALVRDLERTIRADVAGATGRTAAGLALLDGVKGEVPFELIRLPYFSEEYARYLRALFLQRSGCNAEALRLAEVAFIGTPNELHYRAPVHLLRAEIQQRLKNRPAALEEYSRFVALWRACDPALRPVVERAKADLAAMAAEPR
jgi:tetratricopeptide (TPR) repeat protein